MCGTALPAAANDFSLNMCAHGPEPPDILGGQESLIRMVEEELTFHFGKWETRVHARFVFENTSADSTVRQLSGFPDVSVEPDSPFESEYLEEWEIRKFDQEYRHRQPLRNMQTGGR
jgi:hypothetical protein